MLESYLLIMLGSALGGAGRYWCSGVVARRLGETFPWGTFAVNVIGSFIIGFAAALAGPDGRMLLDTSGRQFVMAGICGGYTTFSSFSLQTLNLMRDGRMLHAAGNVGGSVATCLVCVWLGHVAALALNQTRWVLP
jgi:CrcB protein